MYVVYKVDSGGNILSEVYRSENYRDAWHSWKMYEITSMESRYEIKEINNLGMTKNE